MLTIPSLVSAVPYVAVWAARVKINVAAPVGNFCGLQTLLIPAASLAVRQSHHIKETLLFFHLCAALNTMMSQNRYSF